MRLRRMLIEAVFISLIFIGITFVSTSGMCDDTTMENWMHNHTVKVNSTTTYKYEPGYLLVSETYTGEELEERFELEHFTKELKMPVEDNVLVKGRVLGLQEGEERIFVTEKVTVLTTGDDPPQWWYNYTYPQWTWSKSGDLYEKEDPINLAWENTTKDGAKTEILEEGWTDWGTWYNFYVYDPVYGWIADDNVADDPVGLFGRYHARLWQMADGNVVANAHHDSAVPHEANELEEAEELVAGFFNEFDDTEWNVYEDNYDLDNNVSSPYSDGWCTEIYYGLDDTPPIVVITHPTNGSVIETSNVTLTGYATDDVGIVTMCYGYSCKAGGGGGCQDLANFSTNVSFNHTFHFSPGWWYSIEVAAIDEAGNSGNASVTVFSLEGNQTTTFDTGEGTYPSISGVFNGTITPLWNISVSKLYTYPCPGTGGHTEYARIWNSTLDVNATWNGYQYDWHNLTFNNPFILLENETYNYTIRTGSYPQIIHESSFNATGGKITCDKFTDTNGVDHHDWILAIKFS